MSKESIKVTGQKGEWHITVRARSGRVVERLRGKNLYELASKIKEKYPSAKLEDERYGSFFVGGRHIALG